MSENCRFFIHYSANYLKVGTCSQLDGVMKLNEYFPWPLNKVADIFISKLVFLRNYWTIWNQIWYESLLEQGNENLFTWV